MPAEKDPIRIAAVGPDVPVEPGDRIGGVLYLLGKAVGRGVAIGGGDEDRGRGDDGRRHEAHPLLAAVDPGSAMQEAQNR